MNFLLQYNTKIKQTCFSICFFFNCLQRWRDEGIQKRFIVKNIYIYAQNNYWYLMTHSDDILLFEFQSPQERVISLLQLLYIGLGGGEQIFDPLTLSNPCFWEYLFA